MDEIIEFLTSKEIIVVYLVVGVACFLYFIISLVDKNYYKRKRKHNTRELNKLVEDVHDELEKENVLLVEDSKEPAYMESNDEMIYVEPVVQEYLNEPVIIENIGSKETSSSFPIMTLEELQNDSSATGKTELVTIDIVSEQENNALSYTDIELNQTEAQQELAKLTEELEEAQSLQNIDLTSYEEVQERDAIISLDELFAKSKELYENNEVTQYVDEGNEPISLQDLEKKLQEATALSMENVDIIEEKSAEITEPVQQRLVLDDFNNIKIEDATIYPENKQFKSSPIISPVYGIAKEKTTNDIELENTANYEKLDEEIKKTNEFLQILKELQKKLD